LTAGIGVGALGVVVILCALIAIACYLGRFRSHAMGRRREDEMCRGSNEELKDKKRSECIDIALDLTRWEYASGA
jgi:hypothetical protein